MKLHTVAADVAVHISARESHKPICGQKLSNVMHWGQFVPVDHEADCKKCLEIVKSPYYADGAS